ncbi:putative ubiquitinyl hydrolase 1 [Helianthus annuus]|uniref:Putative ubiquitin carboxyl-terminal hydrolase 7, ICP0-binding domain-containing protein n=1 Tax=Helianthus annuus TaxID=4232 RepID=A0A251T3Z8_HELAN|nr:putative ubiquitinyl hydrolase 1 [Helianthus annuus]KAJ0489294.1 putative ubiquitinyl hydrolase 1 [Helianthus annuus]KAJ0493042.1 putative ubiquitinyl hydrolase 1 [Helianthus annuus]KAJ0505172.1 putative ubiquitinyl hydrolase 1 [Helianthus annuus]KAJ0674857.1 putative ubiquitinyl hydrolase 1 [Helianthus annuus]
MVKNAELHLFLEVEGGWDLQPMPLPEKTEEEIMLFFKFYDRKKDELRYVGRLFIKGTGKPIDILSKLKQLAGIEQGEEIELVEVSIIFSVCYLLLLFFELFVTLIILPYRKFVLHPILSVCTLTRCLLLKKASFKMGTLFALRRLLMLKILRHRYPDVLSFLKYVHNRQ